MARLHGGQARAKAMLLRGRIKPGVGTRLGVVATRARTPSKGRNDDAVQRGRLELTLNVATGDSRPYALGYALDDWNRNVIQGWDGDSPRS
jgi:hypothetical protein